MTTQNTRTTPGPWMTHGRYVITGNVGPIDALNVEDARLIALCPRMVEALRLTVAHVASLMDNNSDGETVRLWAADVAALEARMRDARAILAELDGEGTATT